MFFEVILNILLVTSIFKYNQFVLSWDLIFVNLFLRELVEFVFNFRPGGRIHSCWLGDVVAEMGATWIEGGCVANPVFTLAAQEGLLKSPLSRPDPSRGLFCTSDGRAIDLPVSITAYHTFRQIEQQAAALFALGCGRAHGTLLNFMGIRIQQELQNFPEEQRYSCPGHSQAF